MGCRSRYNCFQSLSLTSFGQRDHRGLTHSSQGGTAIFEKSKSTYRCFAQTLRSFSGGSPMNHVAIASGMAKRENETQWNCCHNSGKNFFLSRPSSRQTTAKISIANTGDDELSDWQCMEVLDGFLRLELTLFCGQVFRWIEKGSVKWRRSSYREYVGVINDTAYVLRQRELEPCSNDGEKIYYRILNTEKSDRGGDSQLRDYFNADVDMRPIFASICDRDSRFREVFPYLQGVRTLRQPPGECLFAFICSSNNNVKRITGMVTHLATVYGQYLGTYKGTDLHAFPSTECLASSAFEDSLRNARFGYRAKFIVKAASQLHELGGEQFLLSLRRLPRTDVASALTGLHGIGRKVAGCIALMSLDCEDEIPCDTHVWQIAVRDYLPHLRSETLTDRIYTQIGDHFRQLHGPYAGWASNILFLAELSDFRDRIPQTLRRSAIKRIGKSKQTKKISDGSAKCVKSEELDVVDIASDIRKTSLRLRKTKRIKRSGSSK